MENVIATIINKEGDPSLQIKSPKMIHYPENDTTHIETPHITIFRQSPEPWIVNSDFAKASKGIQQIDFWSNVVIHHEHDIKAPITTMTTTSLTVFPSEKIAQTEDAIVLTQPDTTIHAIGMYANLNEGYVKLLSAARGEYVPKP
jgi:lipopolysaccharide export system protein LptC